MFVVVSSILVAFALDAWWDGRLLRKDERQNLIGLRAEFSAVTRQLQEEQMLQAEIASVCDTLLAHTGPAPTIPPDFKRLLNRAFVARTLDLSTGTLDALMAGGRLEILRSEALRSALAGWHGKLLDATEDETNARAHFFSELVPLLADGERVRARVALGTQPLPPTGFEQNPQALLRDPRFASALDYRSQWLRHVVNELADAETEARRILMLIESELK